MPDRAVVADIVDTHQLAAGVAMIEQAAVRREPEAVGEQYAVGDRAGPAIELYDIEVAGLASSCLNTE